MNDSWAIGRPGHSLIGTRVRLLSSSVSVPFQPGSQNPAVAWTISPKRPSDDLPSMRATMSSGSSTHSSVRPRQNSPGWMTNGSSSSTTTCSVRFSGGSRRSIAVMRWLWNTRNERPRRRSTLAGWTRWSSHGSMRMRPSSTRRRIVPSESTDVTVMAGSLAGPGDGGTLVFGALCAVGAPRAGHDGARARRGRQGRVAVRAAARPGRGRPARGVVSQLGAAVVAAARVVGVLGLLVHRPPDDPQQADERKLEDQNQVDEGPVHAADATPPVPRAHAVLGDGAQASADRAWSSPWRGPPGARRPARRTV